MNGGGQNKQLDTGKYYRRNMKKPGTRKGQKGTGNKRATIGQLHDGIIW